MHLSVNQKSLLDLPYIDGLRGLCSLYVAACHAYLMYSPTILEQAPDGASRILVFSTLWLSFGRIAVAVFMVISGYCLMLPVLNNAANRSVQRTWFHFMQRRAKRILPPYYGALILSIALIVAVPGLDDPAIGEWHKSFPALTIESVLSHLALVHNYFPGSQYAINHPMWSIATEWQIYFFFPFLVWIWSRYGSVRLITASLAICAILLYSLILFWPEHNPWPPQFFVLFGLGMVGAAYNHSGTSENSRPDGMPQWGKHAIWLCVLGIISTALYWINRQQVQDLLIGCSTVCAMIYLTNEHKWNRRPFALCLFEWRPIVSLGRFSYSLYLLHAPMLAIFFVLAKNLDFGFTAIQFFILGIALPCSVAASYLFYLVFERPFAGLRVFLNKP